MWPHRARRRLALLALLAAAPVAQAAHCSLFVLTGQSNALGTPGTTDEAMRLPAVGQHPAEQPGGVPFLWDNRADGTPEGDAALGASGGWVLLGAQAGGVYPGNDQHWGAEIGFARRLWNAGYRDFAIVKAARGGGGNTFWHKGSTDDHMYQHLLATVAAATASPPPGYTSCHVAAVLYVQGESNDSAEAAAAGTRFAELLENLAADLPASAGAAGIFGEIAGGGTTRDTTRANQLALAVTRPGTGYAESTGLTVHNQDGLAVHYDAESQMMLGARLAAEAIRLGTLPGKPLPAWSALHGWFSGADGTGLDAAGAVIRWADLRNGGAARDLTRRVAGQVLRRAVTTGAGEVRHVLRFDGLSDLWASSGEFGALSGPRSVALLCRVTGAADGFLFDGSTGSGKTRAQVRAGVWQAGCTPSADAWNGAETATVARTTGAWQQHVFTFTPDGAGGTTVQHWLDGALAATVTDPQSSALGGFIVGSNGGTPFSRLAVDVAEAAVFSAALDAAQVAELKDGWDTRWGTPTGPPFHAAASQAPREVARFGRHVLLDLDLDCPASGVNSLEQVRVRLAPGTRGAVERVALVAADGGATLAEAVAPAADELAFELAAPLAEGTNRFHVVVVPRRHAPLGAALDAAVVDLTVTGRDAGTYVPETPDPAGALTLALVPWFADVRASGEGGVHTYRIPGIAAGGDGALHAVYDHRYTSSADLPADIDVGYSRSTDGGATWSPSRVILDFDAAVAGSAGNGVGDPCILVDPATGTLWVAALWSFGDNGYNGSGAGVLPAETGQYVLVRSDDGGDNWSAPINVTAAVKDNPAWRLIFQGPGHGLALRDGTLVFPSQYRDESGVVRSCSVFSADHGQTWDFGSSVPTASPQTNEATACELDDGRLLFSMRTPAGSNGQRAWARYAPAGSTPLRDGAWEPLFRLPAVPDPVCQGSVIQWTSRHRGHPHEWILFGNPASSSSRVNFTLRVSPDGGDTWPVARLLYAGSAAYSSLCILPDRSLGILLEKDNYTRITFARVEADWLLESAGDADADGLPDAWESLAGLDPEIADGHFDADFDGMDNRAEQLAGTDPLDRNSRFGMTSIAADGQRLAVQWRSVPGVCYALEDSDDLLEWRTIPGHDGIVADGPLGSATVADDAAPRRFLRVRVVP